MRHLAPGFIVLLLAASPARGQQTGGDGWLGAVAREYVAWGRVDDELRWAPWLCRMPTPSRARVSRAEAAPHGRKVYFVYASDRAAYLELVAGARDAPPRGLTVVKEAFHPQEIHLDAAGGSAPIPGRPSPGPASEALGPGRGSEVYLPIRDGARLLGAGEPGGLYVLRYLGRAARGTDEGWTYGTVSPDGQVTSSGRVERCVACHRSAPHGRLFGTGP